MEYSNYISNSNKPFYFSYSDVKTLHTYSYILRVLISHSVTNISIPPKYLKI